MKCKDCGGRDGHMPYCPGGIDRMTRKRMLDALDTVDAASLAASWDKALDKKGDDK